MQFLLIDPGLRDIREVCCPMDPASIIVQARVLIGTNDIDTMNMKNHNTILFLAAQETVISQQCCLIKGGLNKFVFGKAMVVNMDVNARDEITTAFLKENLPKIIEFFPAELGYAIKQELRIGLSNGYSVN